MILLKKNFTPKNSNRPLLFSVFHLVQHLLVLVFALFKTTGGSDTLPMCGLFLPVCLIKRNFRSVFPEK